MVNFMCQLDEATGYPNTWLHTILGVSVRVFLNEIGINRLSEADCPSQHGQESACTLEA